jgi:predicted transcriptional regulator
MSADSVPPQSPPPAPPQSPSTPSLSVASIMIGKVHTVSPDMTVRDAIKLLLKNKIAGAPIVDSSNKVMSVVSEGDLLKLAATQGLDKTIFQCLIRLTRSEKLLTLKKTDSFADAYKKFLTNSVHRLIVVDDMGKLEGIVSRSNVLRVLAGPDQA